MSELNARLVVLVDYALKKRMRAICVAQDLSLSDEVRRLVERWVEEHEKPRPKSK